MDRTAGCSALAEVQASKLASTPWPALDPCHGRTCARSEPGAVGLGGEKRGPPEAKERKICQITDDMFEKHWGAGEKQKAGNIMGGKAWWS